MYNKPYTEIPTDNQSLPVPVWSSPPHPTPPLPIFSHLFPPPPSKDLFAFPGFL